MNARQRRKEARRRALATHNTENDRKRVLLRKRVRHDCRMEAPRFPRPRRGRVSANARRAYRRRLRTWLEWDQLLCRPWVDGLNSQALDQALAETKPKGRAVPKSTTLARMMLPPLDPSRVG